MSPGKSETIASLDLVSLLNRDDLPTFGRPIIATEVNIVIAHFIDSPEECPILFNTLRDISFNCHCFNFVFECLYKCILNIFSCINFRS